MTVFRRPKQNNYFASRRDWMQDNRLSNPATGLLAKMLSMPPAWEFKQSQLASVLRDGKDAIRTQLKELVKYGYAVKHPQARLEDGRMGAVSYDVFDVAQFDGELSDKAVQSLFVKGLTQKAFDAAYREIQEMIPKADIPLSACPLADNPPLEDKQSRNPTDKQSSKKRERGGAPPKPPARPPKKKTPPKVERRPNVSTTDEEHLKLAEEHGEIRRDEAYQFISDWKANTPKAKWKPQDYLSIKNWVFDALDERKQKKKRNVKPGNQMTKENEGQYDNIGW